MIKTPFANDGDSRWSPVAYLVRLVVVAGIVALAVLGPGATTANVDPHDYRGQSGNLAQVLIRPDHQHFRLLHLPFSSTLSVNL